MSRSTRSTEAAPAQGGPPPPATEPLELAIEGCRAYLLMVAGKTLDPDLRAKVAPSDLVQDTFLRAKASVGSFRGDPDGLRAWLRQILINELAHVRRHFRTGKANVGLESPIAASAPLADTKSPSRIAIRREEGELLTIGLSLLEDADRQILEWRHQERLEFAEIARRLAITPEAARKRWARAVERLQVAVKSRP